MVNVVITAPRGAMDSLIIQEAYKNENINVVGVVGAPGRSYIGSDAGLVCGLGTEIGVPVSDEIAWILWIAPSIVRIELVSFSAR